MDSILPYQNINRVYCAGPLFNEAERRAMEEIAAALRRGGFETFVPHADGLEFTPVCDYLCRLGMDRAQAGDLLHRAIFALDIYQVAVGCGSLIFNMDGRVPDEGGVAEMSIAWTLGKPIVIYKNDVRTKISGRDNPLVVGQTDFQTVERREISPALRVAMAVLAPDPRASVPTPPSLMKAIQNGERLWALLVTLGESRPADRVSECILKLFSPAGTTEPAASR